MDFAELWQMGTPAIATLNIGEKNTLKGEAVFGALINTLVKFFAAIWTPAQIADCAKVCFDEWYYLSFAELAHFSQRARSGYFKEPGKPLFYGPFSPANVIDWFCTYTAENLQQREAYFANAGNDSKWAPPSEPVSAEQIIAFKHAVAALEQQVTADKKEEEQARTQKRAVGVQRFQAFMQQTYEAKTSVAVAPAP